MKDPISKREFAELLKKVQDAHFASWDGNGYTLSLSKAAEQHAGEWAVIVDIILMPGYCEVAEWCEARGVKMEEAASGG